MKLILAGGSGQVGTILARAFHAEGHDVVVLSRSPRPDLPWRSVEWDAKTFGAWAGEVDGADVVINLAGRSVNCRYNEHNRRLIRESRTDSVRAIGEAIRRADRGGRPPRVWLQMSTATIYAHTHDREQDEATGTLGVTPEQPDTWHFSYDVACSWEAAANGIQTPRTRKVLLRTAMVMSPDRGGVFDMLLRLVRLGLGGRAGDGRQFVSWIHDADLVAAARFLIDHDDLAGPVNLASPNPLPNARFMRELRQAWGQPIGLPATKGMIELGTRLMRTESELVLKSRRVVPGRLCEAGFVFAHPTWPEAAADLCARRRASPTAS